ncbi:hypothetical protein BDR26DRAFT_718953 [Obelidium mucronatum]|nr:hypothetical protein BDR26DRAFT_718953 [Obelidium mucronatum]
MAFAPFFVTGRFADAILRADFGEPHGSVLVPVHRVVLAAQSPVLDSIFEKGESTQSTTTTTTTTTTILEYPVPLPRGCSEAGLRLALEWLYFGHCSFALNQAFSLLAVATALQIDSLKVHVNAFISRAISGEQVVVANHTGKRSVLKITRAKLEWEHALMEAIETDQPLFMLHDIVYSAARDLRKTDRGLSEATKSFIEYSFILGVFDFCNNTLGSPLNPIHCKNLLNAINYSEFKVSELEILQDDVQNNRIPNHIALSAMMLAVKKRENAQVLVDFQTLPFPSPRSETKKLQHFDDTTYQITSKGDTITPITTHPTKRRSISSALFTPPGQPSWTLSATNSTATTIKVSEVVEEEEEFHDTVEYNPAESQLSPKTHSSPPFETLSTLRESPKSVKQSDSLPTEKKSHLELNHLDYSLKFFLVIYFCRSKRR